MSKISICKTCSQEILVAPGAKGIYCSRKCHIADQSQISKRTAAVRRAVLEQKYQDNPKLCPQCQTVLTFEQRGQKYCSRSCSASYSNQFRVHSEESKAKRSLKARTNPSGFAKSKIGGANRKGILRAPRVFRNCTTCSRAFEIIASDPRKTCSKECVKIGGPRIGSGRAKTGYFKSIYCGSTYELAFLIWHLDNKQYIKRCQQHFGYVWNDQYHNYYPDFEVDGQIYEIKGQISDVDFVKIKAANAVLVDKDTIKTYIDYVATKYKVARDKLWLLYDQKEYMECQHCKTSFLKKHKNSKYCSQSCSLKANRSFRKKSL
jgi:hypothetical protein